LSAQFLTEDKELLARAGEFSQCTTVAECLQENIRAVSREHGIALGTAVLYDRVLRHPEHRQFFERVRSCPVDNHVQDAPLFGIVPGAFYRQHRNTGADGARLAAILQSMGCMTELVPIQSFGSLATNAGILKNWLRQRKHQRIVLLSLSKGSADVKTCLRLADAFQTFEHVTAWISLSGLPEGTPLVAWLRQQPLRKLGVRLLLGLRRQRYSVVEELRHERGGPLKGWPEVPVPLIHVIGFPLRKHLTHPWAFRGYDRVAALGPNDGGGFLLSDVASLPGIVFPVWGTDHYLEPAWDVTTLLRRVVMTVLEPNLPQTSQSAAKPISPPATRSSA